MRLVAVTPPASEPVTLAEAKLHARIDTDMDDALVSSLITAARRSCETRIRSALVTQTWQLYLDGFPSAGGYYNRAIREIWPSMGGLPAGLGFYPGLVPNSTGVIEIPLSPLQSLTAVEYLDFSAAAYRAVDPSNYTVGTGTPGRIQPGYGQVWPISRPTIDAVRITFVTGVAVGSVSENVKTAIKMLVSGWYENHEHISVDMGHWVVIPETVDALLAPDDPGSYA